LAAKLLSYSFTKDLYGAPHSWAHTSNCKENLQLSLERNKIFCGTDKKRRCRRSDHTAEVVIGLAKPRLASPMRLSCRYRICWQQRNTSQIWRGMLKTRYARSPTK